MAGLALWSWLWLGLGVPAVSGKGPPAWECRPGEPGRSPDQVSLIHVDYALGRVGLVRTPRFPDRFPLPLRCVWVFNNTAERRRNPDWRLNFYLTQVGRTEGRPFGVGWGVSTVFSVLTLANFLSAVLHFSRVLFGGRPERDGGPRPHRSRGMEGNRRPGHAVFGVRLAPLQKALVRREAQGAWGYTLSLSLPRFALAGFRTTITICSS